LVPLALVAASFGMLVPHAAFADSTLQPGQSVVVVGTEGRGLKVRVGPGMAHRVATTIAEGNSVTIVAGPVSDGADDWYQISYPTGTAASGSTSTGWAVSTYLLPTVAVRSMSTDDGSARMFLGKVTAYADGIGGVPLGAKTYSGTKTRWGVVAVDPKVIPIGSALRIEGYDDVIFIAEDVGSGIKGEAVDLWMPDAATAKTYGTQYRRITVLREGPEKSGGISATPGSAPIIPLSAPVLP